MLYSYDGYKWNDLNRIFLKPQIGDSVMRDPSIVRGPDGTFHLVWTLAWKGNKGFGYQLVFMPMADEYLRIAICILMLFNTPVYLSCHSTNLLF